MQLNKQEEELIELFRRLRVVDQMTLVSRIRQLAPPPTTVTDKRDTCANCGKTYDLHLKGTYCRIGSDLKWFPSKLANAIRKSATGS
jgi:hypothetical protein